ncbi:four helix bundle protein [candidate division WOR-3 bacterium]|nr:four helix bundle protein [candidate division WOR-3 bacterium]
MSDSETEAEETRVWLEFSLKCGYLDQDTTKSLDDTYDRILAQIVTMIQEPDKWIIR